jgi:predicted extracellular nuclease
MRSTARFSLAIVSVLVLAATAAFARTAAAATPTDLFFSEYVEGSGNNKALEIYNGTGSPVDLAAGGYAVKMFFNGSSAAGLTVSLTGTVAAGDVYVVANSGADAPVLAQADQVNGAGWFNGDDAVELVKGAEVIDSIGQVGTDPGSQWGSGDTSTQDNTLRRKTSVTAGDTNPTDAFDPSVEWNGFPQDDFDGLGLPGDQVNTPPPPPVLTIGEVQGPTLDSEDGTLDATPYDGQTVSVQGVVTQTILESDGTHAFFLQSTPETSDDDPLTSDGIFVYEGRFGDLSRDDAVSGFYVPQVGDEVVLTGKVQEFFGQTELSQPHLTEIVSSGVAAVPEPFVADPPSELADAYRYWERHEGMQGQVPSGSIALSGRNVFSPADSEIWFARGDSEIAQRDDPYTRRAFRDPHPLDDIASQLFDNGNGYRILVGGFGVKATEDDTSALLTPVRTFDTLTNAPSGGVYFDFGKYSLQVAEQPAVSAGVDPSLNAPPQSFVREKEYSIASFNVENLYDFRDDPNDGCDFVGNAGCPGVSPPFDYVPASEEAYQSRLHDIARQIAGPLVRPDIILVQEAEDQDICTVAGGALQCGTADNADGKPDTLQELALAVAEVGGPSYDAAYDRDGADDRGIVSGFLYRTDRVQLLPASADDPVLGSSPTVQYRAAGLAYNTDVSNPKALNAVLPGDVDRSTGTDGNNVFTRAPQVGHFRVWRVGIGKGSFVDLYAISNHFSSGPDGRVGQRTEQARYNARIVDALQAADPDAKVVLGGDLNVYPRPDDPFPDDPSDQLGPLYEQGLHNLWDTIVAQVPQAAYSYVFEGQAQTLDQMFTTDSLFGDLVVARHAHVNSDWPADEAGDGPHGTSDHDPLVARFRNVPTHAGGTVR